MSQPIMKYKGSLSLKAGTPYTGSTFTLGNCMKMKTKDVCVSINSTDAFPIAYDDEGLIDATVTYTFSIDCLIAFGDVVEVT